MTLDEFWEHIRATRRKDPEAHVERLIKRLAKLPPDEIIDFDHWWFSEHRKAYIRSLWEAAVLINGGASDDGFDYFRDWLILQGREVFEAAIDDPDTLAAVVDPDEEYEYEGFPALSAWYPATGTSDDEGFARFEAARKVRYPKHPGRPVLVEDWDEATPWRQRFPRLAALYSGGERASDGNYD